MKYEPGMESEFHLSPLKCIFNESITSLQWIIMSLSFSFDRYFFHRQEEFYSTWSVPQMPVTVLMLLCFSTRTLLSNENRSQALISVTVTDPVTPVTSSKSQIQANESTCNLSQCTIGSVIISFKNFLEAVNIILQ